MIKAYKRWEYVHAYSQPAAENVASCINTNMISSTRRTKKAAIKPIDLDQKLYEELRRYGVAKSSDHLSELLGKNRSYFRSMKCRQYALNLSSLLRLQLAIDRTASEEINAQRAIMLRYAENVVKSIINERCKIDEVQPTFLLQDKD